MTLNGSPSPFTSSHIHNWRAERCRHPMCNCRHIVSIKPAFASHLPAFTNSINYRTALYNTKSWSLTTDYDLVVNNYNLTLSTTPTSSTESSLVNRLSTIITIAHHSPSHHRVIVRALYRGFSCGIKLARESIWGCKTGKLIVDFSWSWR